MGQAGTCLELTVGIVAVFAVIFLFYTNSFLIKRRKKELGVYQVLGMEKRHLAKMMAEESLIVAGISIVSGLFLGIVLEKMMYLILLKILEGNCKSEIFCKHTFRGGNGPVVCSDFPADLSL